MPKTGIIVDLTMSAGAPVKYYIYISHSKVDMLFPQVPHRIKEKVATEFKLDLKVFSASRKTETETDPNPIARLEAVLAFIREFGNLGTVDEPDEYFADTLPMRWAPAFMLADRKDHADSLQDFVLFGGSTSSTSVALGGSCRHLLGSADEERPGFAWRIGSSMHGVLYMLQLLDGRVDSALGEDMDRGLLKHAIRRLPGPEQELEFMAKRLFYEPLSGEKPILLGTPLYVALAC